MAAETYAYDAATLRHKVTDIKAYSGGLRKDVAIVYAYSGGRKELVWYRVKPTISVSAPYWDLVNVSWTAPNFAVTKYVLRRGSIPIYTGPGLSFTDTYPGSEIRPSSTYTYNLDCYYHDGVAESVEITVSKLVTTPAHADLGLTATAVSYNTIQLRWTDPDQRSIDAYNLYRGFQLIDSSASGADKAHDDGGRSGSTTYSYDLRAYRAGSEISPRDSASATTPAVPLGYGTVWGPGIGSGTGWTQSTTKNLNGPNFSMPRQGYVSSWNLNIGGYSGSVGHFNPHINGSRLTMARYYGDRTVPAGRVWTSIEGSDRNLAAGTHTCGCQILGNASYRTEWAPYTGGDWSTTVAMGQVNYWYYAYVAADIDTQRDTLCDVTGAIVAERVTNTITGAVLEESGDLVALDARIAEG